MEHVIQEKRALPAAPVTIRRAEPAEYDTVGELTVAGFADGPYGHLPKRPERLVLERDVAARAASGEVLLAEIDAEPAGTVTLLRPGTPQSRLAVGGEAELRLLAVLSRFRGRGLARALCEACAELALGWGADAVVLDTGGRNRAAQQLYRSLGYVEFGTPEDFVTRVRLNFRRVLQDHPDFRIRLARPGEAAELVRIALAAYRADYDLPADYENGLVELIGTPGDREVWVAEDRGSGEIAGLVVTGRRNGGKVGGSARAEEIDFRLLSVAPWARRRGVGGLLVEHISELGRLRGATAVVMNSGPQMVNAHRLYRRLAFTEEPARRRRIIRGGEDVELLTFVRPIR